MSALKVKQRLAIVRHRSDVDRVAPKIPLCSWRSCCFSLYSPQQQTQAVSLYDPWADEPHASTEVKASSCTVNKITRRCCSVYSEIISTTSIDNLKINFLIKYWASPRLFWNALNYITTWSSNINFRFWPRFSLSDASLWGYSEESRISVAYFNDEFTCFGGPKAFFICL